MELFIRRGFEAVTVAEIARAAEVSEATVFNYFRTKEDLVYDQLDQVWAGLIEAAKGRPNGTGPSTRSSDTCSIRESVRQPQRAARLAALTQMIVGSPGLLARERTSYDRAARELAAVIARTAPLRADAAASAHMILGVHRSLVADTREQILAGTEPAALKRRVSRRTRSGCALLRQGPGV